MTDVTKESVDFSGLILGFSSAALHYLGVAAVPGRETVANLPLAKQNIEIIRMLSEKTKGNLTEDESKLVQQLLADLQAKWVEASRP